MYKREEQGLCLTTDCNSRYMYLDPETGGKIAVSEAARNITVSYTHLDVYKRQGLS